eukprot:2030685-Amphidinium_carterae.1
MQFPHLPGNLHNARFTSSDLSRDMVWLMYSFVKLCGPAGMQGQVAPLARATGTNMNGSAQLQHDKKTTPSMEKQAENNILQLEQSCKPPTSSENKMRTTKHLAIAGDQCTSLWGTATAPQGQIYAQPLMHHSVGYHAPSLLPTKEL